MSKEKKPREEIGFFRIARITYGMLFTEMPFYYTSQQIIAILHGLSWGVISLATQFFFDGVNKAAQTYATGKTFDFLLLAAGLAVYGGVTVSQQLLNGIHTFMHGVIFNRMNGYTNALINAKSSRISAVEFENPKKLDDINKAHQGAGNCMSFALVTTTLFTFYLPYFIFMAFYLFNVNKLLVFGIVAAFVPSMAALLFKARIMSGLEDKIAPLRRRFGAYENAVCGRESFKETRIHGGFGYFYKLFINCVKQLNKENMRSRRKTGIIELGLGVLTLVCYGAVLLYLINLLISGVVSLGQFAAVYFSVEMLFSIMDEIVARHIGSLSENYGTIRNFIRFIEMPERGGEEREFDRSCGISVNDVHFSYPNAEKETLRGISLEIKAGETVAIVGENGAGKTTLVKLLTGIYMPDGGSVTVGGIDTSVCAANCLFGSMSGIFQKYQKYKLTLCENVRISDMDNGGDVTDALEESGVDHPDTATYPGGLETVLSRDFDGVDLSGGQWQRIAIARGLFRSHGLIVLDEPTAAIDPLEETRIYTRFAELARDKTAVIVTHRMGMVKTVDRVIVMNDGLVEDSGTHDELFARGGRYRDMYESQAQWYSAAEKP